MENDILKEVKLTKRLREQINITYNLHTMNLDESIKRINLEIESISKVMKEAIKRQTSKADFVREMYNNYKIICL